MDKLRISGRLDDLFSFTIFFQYDTLKKKRFVYVLHTLYIFNRNIIRRGKRISKRTMVLRFRFQNHL